MEEAHLDNHLRGIGATEILDAIADGAYITDRNRKIVFWSRAAERITGWQAHEVVGHKCSDNILVHVDKDGHRLCENEYCPLHRSIVTGTTSTEPLLVYARHKQGHRVPVEVSVAPLRDRNGTVVGGVEVFRDFSNMIEDLRRARIIQNHVLATDLPKDDRIRFEVAYAPEELVGGDFYRVEAIDANLYSVMVADVMGHGLASALYTMQLRSIWEDCRAELVSPASFLAELNRRLYQFTSPDGYFASAVCLTVNVETDEIVYVRAGHPAPLLFRSDGTFQHLWAKSPAVGLLENAVYSEARAKLGPGDGLLLFTDGAVEITNPGGEELGEEGLARLMTGLGDARFELGVIERKLLEFTNRIRLPDDLTLLSVYRKPSV